MKTAEEWAQVVGYKHTDWIEPHLKTLSGSAFIDIVREVQLDAMKEGMTRAAVLVMEEQMAWKEVGNNQVAQVLTSLDNAILTARDQLKME